MRDLAIVVARPHDVLGIPEQAPRLYWFNVRWLRLVTALSLLLLPLLLVFTGAALVLGRFTPEGEQIAFMSARNGNWDIYVLDLARQVTINLTNSPQYADRYPTWSPDGSQIAFHSDRSGNWDIYVMAADGGNVRQLTTDFQWDAMAAWSPDGSQIAFHSNRTGPWNIYTMNADGTNQLALFKTQQDALWPSWSPDGTRIAFAIDNTDDMDTSIDLYVYDFRVGEVSQLTDTDGQDTFPRWAPQGSRLAFHSNRYGEEDILVMDMDSAGVSNLTPGEMQTFYFTNEWNSTWSPDASQMIFVSSRDGNWELYLLDVASSAILRRLTVNGWEDGAPSWRPHGG